MPRLFVALSIPEPIAEQMIRLQTGLRGARWRPRENFHLTLRFIGDVDGHVARDAHSELSDIRAPAFDVALDGCGQFGDRRPRAVWAGTRPEPALTHLQAKIETALQRAGLTPEGRKFTPHVTLAYLKGAKPRDVAEWTSGCGLFQTPAFHVDAFHLYSSQMGNQASAYAIEETYSLDAVR